MLSRTFRPLLLAFAFLPLLVAAGETEDPLAMFDPLVGKTWKGEGTAGEVAGKTDIMSWQRIMGGEAVQQTHSINDGEYGGVTIFFFDPLQNTVIFHYFTTAKLHSTGTVERAENGDILAIEHVQGVENLVEARGRMVFHEEGWETRASYLKDGEWVEGDGFRYFEAPAEDVVFRPAR